MLPRRRLTGSLRASLLVATAIVCASSLFAEDFGGAAKVLVMTGRVSIFRDNYEVAVNVGTVVQPKQLIVTGPNGYAKFELADGSTFEVFQDAKVVFRPTIGLLDLLDVWIGHVKVYIEHKNGPNYNRVTTQTAVISVRGTVFDVAVEDEDTTLVSVDEGVVGVRHALLPGNEVQLLAGQSLRVYKDQPLARNVDKGPGIRMALRAAAQAAYEALARRGVGAAGAPTGGGSTGGTAQGDKGKGGSTGNTGGTSGSTGGAPPPPPPAPPNP